MLEANVNESLAIGDAMAHEVIESLLDLLFPEAEVEVA
jgi:hypothetical protein